MARAQRTAPDRRKRRSTLRAWMWPLLFALLGALFIRVFILEAFRIPTASMEQSLLAGDFVLVSKVHYGARSPLSAGVPFTPIYAPRLELPAYRLPGVTGIRRGDVIVFNYPAEYVPIDRKTHYIKRVIGLPGDSLSIVNKVPYVNGQPLPLGEQMQQRWVASLLPGAAFPFDSLRTLGAEQVARRAPDQVLFEATPALARQVASWEAVRWVKPFVSAYDPGFGLRFFPEGHGYGRDNYGPVYVPARDDTLRLSAASWPFYEAIITRYEKHQARQLEDGAFEIDGERTFHYVVAQDYYFVMGDNRDLSSDSRVWGFVPKDHIVGKAVLVYFSWDTRQRRPRLDRLFRPVR